MNDLQSKIWSIIDKRASIRSFSEKEVKNEIIEFLLQCASTAPSNGNMQPWEFIVVDSQEVKNQIVKCTYSGYFSKGKNHQLWISEAPIVLAACANQKRTRARYGDMGALGSIIDTAAAIQTLLIAAAGIGLASCWVGGFDEDKLKDVLSIPKHVKPVGVLPIGYPKERGERKNRMPLKLITFHNFYNH